MLHVYELTGDTLAVSMVAVVGLVPMIIAGLYGGMLAEAFDRRLVALVAASVTFVSTLLLAVLAWTGHESVAWLFVLSAVNSSANSIVGATKSAITPRLLPRALLPAAAALQGITVGIMVMAGPALAGAFGWFAPARVDETHANLTLIVLAMIVLAVTGAADNISAIYRSTMMQAAVPDAARRMRRTPHPIERSDAEFACFCGSSQAAGCLSPGSSPAGRG